VRILDDILLALEERRREPRVADGLATISRQVRRVADRVTVLESARVIGRSAAPTFSRPRHVRELLPAAP